MVMWDYSLFGVGGGGGGGGIFMGGGGGGIFGLIIWELILFSFIRVGVDRLILVLLGRLFVWIRWFNFCFFFRSLESYSYRDNIIVKFMVVRVLKVYGYLKIIECFII